MTENYETHIKVVAPHLRQFYIDGNWVTPKGRGLFDVVNPATEQSVAQIALGSVADADDAVAAAKAALPGFSAWSKEDRIALLKKISEVYDAHAEEMAHLVSIEMGAPIRLARDAQVQIGRDHFKEMIRAAGEFTFVEQRGRSKLIREAIGVVACITPWNWPLNQIVCKVAPAIVAGCTVVLKPSEYSPLDALLFARIMHEAGVPAGVFNLVNGDGPTVGEALARHPDVAMVSFTGSTRAGIRVAEVAAPTIKRVHQELGGKSANILLDGVDLEQAVTKGVKGCFGNSGQSCNAPTRMLVPIALQDRAAEIAGKAAEQLRVGTPDDPATDLGPVVNRVQFDKIQGLISSGIAEGARLVVGGPDLPQGLNRGYYVRPTVFSHASTDMRIAREEIFGPVLTIIGYEDEEEAIAIANGTDYGLAGYVQSPDTARGEAVAMRLQAGNVYVNYPTPDFSAPFGGYKHSGNGKEYGEWGLDAFLEFKAITV